ncbi:hypothetical protein BJ165DRAFT_1078042 [Panaeolus papilionaceus]|nr:hypothetical protein BJ165DRAFT_1078042 [Panaeolus papilionaceus]
MKRMRRGLIFRKPRYPSFSPLRTLSQPIIPHPTMTPQTPSRVNVLLALREHHQRLSFRVSSVNPHHCLQQGKGRHVLKPRCPISLFSLPTKRICPLDVNKAIFLYSLRLQHFSTFFPSVTTHPRLLYRPALLTRVSPTLSDPLNNPLSRFLLPCPVRSPLAISTHQHSTFPPGHHPPVLFRPDAPPMEQRQTPAYIAQCSTPLPKRSEGWLALNAMGGVRSEAEGGWGCSHFNLLVV